MKIQPTFTLVLKALKKQNCQASACETYNPDSEKGYKYMVCFTMKGDITSFSNFMKMLSLSVCDEIFIKFLVGIFAGKTQKRNSLPMENGGGREKVEVCLQDGKAGGRTGKSLRQESRTLHPSTQWGLTGLFLLARHTHFMRCSGYRLNKQV